MARIRTFVAVGLDRAVRDRTVALQQKLAEAGADVKWVEPENLHVTLLFLGEVGDRDLPAVCRSVAEVCHPVAPFRLSIETAGCFPNPRRPRTLWVGASEGTQEVVALHDALEPPLLELGCYRREDRPYTPHVTLGRVKGDGAGEPLAAALARYAGWQGGTVAVRDVHVMASELTPKGPVYTIMSRAKLGGQS